MESFSSIVVCIEYGRLVFDNLKKTVLYLLPAGTFCELWPILFTVFFGLPQILSSIEMIIISMLTDCVASMSLIKEKPEADLLLRMPRRPEKAVDAVFEDPVYMPESKASGRRTRSCCEDGGTKG